MKQKRGRKPWNESNRLLPFHLIARELNCSVRTVAYDYKRAVRKLKQQGQFNLLLDCVHAVETLSSNELRAGSMECQQEYCELFSDGGTKDAD